MLTHTPRLLVADDQPDVVTALRLLLRGEGFEADAASSVQEVRGRLSGTAYDLLLMDLNYARDTTSGREGLELLAEVHARDPLLPVVVMTGWATIDTAIEAMRRGARTFVTKPWDNAVLAESVRREIEHGRALRHADRLAAREQSEAQAIQRALLPATPPAMEGCDLAARWTPATAFGGDCYDTLPIGDGKLLLSIADVCGKGLPAALVMANLQASARAFAAADPSPAALAARINRELARDIGLRRFVTCVYAIYDTQIRQLRFTNAGHNPPLLVRAEGHVERLTGGGTVLGAFADAAFDEHAVTLAPGDRLVFFTDGIVEAENGQGEPFGDTRLEAAARDHRQFDANGLVAAICDEVAAFASCPLVDDATVMVMGIAA